MDNDNDRGIDVGRREGGLSAGGEREKKQEQP